MNFLLTALSVLGVSAPSTLNATNIIGMNKAQMDVYSKIKLSSIKIKDAIFDIEGDDSNIEDVEIMVFLSQLMDENNEDFFNHYLENKDQYVTMGEINRLPDLNEKIIFKYKIAAKSANKIYSGFLTFNITLMNSGNAGSNELVPANKLNYDYNYRIWTAGWIWDEKTDTSSNKILYWKQYAPTWEEFLNKFGKGQNMQNINVDIKAYAETDFYSSSQINDTVNIELSSITKEKTENKKDGQHISMYSKVGTSKVTASFYISYYRDDEFIYIDTYFNIGLSAWPQRYIKMNASVDNLKFVRV